MTLKQYNTVFFKLKCKDPTQTMTKLPSLGINKKTKDVKRVHHEEANTRIVC